MGKDWKERFNKEPVITDKAKENAPTVVTGNPPIRDDLKDGQQLWVTIVRGPTVRKNDDDWQMFHLATLIVQAHPERGGISIVGATLSEPMDRLDVEEHFRRYVADNIFPSEHEW